MKVVLIAGALNETSAAIAIFRRAGGPYSAGKARGGLLGPQTPLRRTSAASGAPISRISGHEVVIMATSLQNRRIRRKAFYAT